MFQRKRGATPPWSIAQSCRIIDQGPEIPTTLCISIISRRKIHNMRISVPCIHLAKRVQCIRVWKVMVIMTGRCMWRNWKEIITRILGIQVNPKKYTDIIAKIRPSGILIYLDSHYSDKISERNNYSEIGYSSKPSSACPMIPSIVSQHWFRY